MERYNCRVRFKDLVIFIERQVKIVSDPLFGDIQDVQCGSAGLKGAKKSQAKFSRVRSDSFATTVTVVDSTKASRSSCSVSQRQDSMEKANRVCVCCSRVHSLEESKSAF